MKKSIFTKCLKKRVVILKSLFLCLVQIASFLFTCLQVYRLFLLSVSTLLYIMFLFFSGFWLWCALVGFKKNTYSGWCLSFLDMQVYKFHQIWKSFSHYFLYFSCSAISSLPRDADKNVRLLLLSHQSVIPKINYR